MEGAQARLAWVITSRSTQWRSGRKPRSVQVAAQERKATNSEAHIPTQHPEAGQDPWIPVSDVDEGRPSRPSLASGQGPPPSDCLGRWHDVRSIRSSRLRPSVSSARPMVGLVGDPSGWRSSHLGALSSDHKSRSPSRSAVEARSSATGSAGGCGPHCSRSHPLFGVVHIWSGLILRSQTCHSMN